MPSLGTAAMSPRVGSQSSSSYFSSARGGSNSTSTSPFIEYDEDTDFDPDSATSPRASGAASFANYSPNPKAPTPRASNTHNSSGAGPSHGRTTSLHASPAIPQNESSFKHRREQSLGISLGGGGAAAPVPLAERRPRLSSLRALPARPMTVFAEPPPPPSGLRAFYESNKGLAYVLLAQVFGVLMNVTTRLLEIEGNKGMGMHPFQILFVRMTITTVLSTSYMWWAKIPHFPFGMPEVRWLLILRGIGGFFGVFGMYYSLLFLPLADATVVTFIAPSVSCFACSFILKEPFTRMEQLGAAISFIGVTLIARPTALFQGGASGATTAHATTDANAAPHNSDRLGAVDLNDVSPSQRFSAICVALVGVFGSAMAFTVMRMIGKRAHPLLSVNYFCAWCTMVSALAMIILPDVKFLLPADSKEWAYLIFLGICGFAMQFLLSAGLQREKSSRATLMVYTQMIFALFFDRLVFGTNPSLLSLLGSGLILTSAIYVALHKESQKRRQEEERRRAEAEAASSGVDVEMQGRTIPEENRGLVSGMDADDDEKANRQEPKSVG